MSRPGLTIDNLSTKAVTRALDALPEADGGGLAQLEAWRVDKFIPFNPVDKRTEATCVDAEGRGHVYSKGAPNVMVALAADSPQIRAAAEDRILANAERGLRSLGVARLVDVPGDAGASAGKVWQLLGLIALLDPPRDDTAATVSHRLGTTFPAIYPPEFGGERERKSAPWVRGLTDPTPRRSSRPRRRAWR